MTNVSGMAGRKKTTGGLVQHRLEELYQYIHSLNPKKKGSEQLRKKILAFAGSFDGMSKKDYSDFLKQTKKTRTKFFNRNVDL